MSDGELHTDLLEATTRVRVVRARAVEPHCGEAPMPQRDGEDRSGRDETAPLL